MTDSIPTRFSMPNVVFGPLPVTSSQCDHCQVRSDRLWIVPRVEAPYLALCEGCARLAVTDFATAQEKAA